MILLVLIPGALLAMCVAAGILEAIGAQRVARALGLPPDDYR